MGALDRLRRWIWRTEDAANNVDYKVLDAVHHAEDRLDERTHGRFYDRVEKTDEDAGEVLERLHLDGPDDDSSSSGQ